MNEPLPVTEEDVLLAWRDYYHEPEEPEKKTHALPTDSYFDQLMMRALRQVLEGDRRRVVERSK